MDGKAQSELLKRVAMLEKIVIALASGDRRAITVNALGYPELIGESYLAHGSAVSFGNK